MRALRTARALVQRKRAVQCVRTGMRLLDRHKQAQGAQNHLVEARSRVLRGYPLYAYVRRRYRELFREEIAQTVAGRGELNDELKHVFAVLSQ